MVVVEPRGAGMALFTLRAAEELGRRCSAWPRASSTPRWSRSPRRLSHSGLEVPIRRCIEIVRFRRDTGGGRRCEKMPHEVTVIKGRGFPTSLAQSRRFAH